MPDPELLEPRDAFERRMAETKGDICFCGHMEFRHAPDRDMARQKSRIKKAEKEKRIIYRDEILTPCWQDHCQCITFERDPKMAGRHA